MVLIFLVQAAEVNDGGVTEMGEHVGKREVRSSISDTLSTNCKLHLSDPRESSRQGWVSVGERVGPSCSSGVLSKQMVRGHRQPPWGQMGFRIQLYSNCRKIIHEHSH